MQEQQPQIANRTVQLAHERALLARLAPLARAEILRAYSPDSCIVSTAIGIDVLSHFGLKAAPLSVEAMVLNRPFIEHLAQHGAFPTTEDETQRWSQEGCYAVQIDTKNPRRPGGWPGHLVAVAERRWLVDLSLDQFTRPEHGIEVVPLYERASERFLRGRENLVIETRDGLRIVYRARPWDRRFEATPDWRPPDELRQHEREATVERILERLAAWRQAEAEEL